MIRLNITLADDIAKELANKHNKSRFITEALKEKLERERRKRIGSLLLEGYKVTYKEDIGLQADWENIEIEGWQ